MISFDPYVVSFIQGNVLTVGLVILILRGIAKLTTTKKDDEFVEVLSDAVGKVTGGKK
jgi:hypothetical protein